MIFSTKHIGFLLLLVTILLIDFVPSVESKKKKKGGIGKKKHRKSNKKMTTATIVETRSLSPTITNIQTVQQVTVPKGLYTINGGGCYCPLQITT
jgi:hypothetical protein